MPARTATPLAGTDRPLLLDIGRVIWRSWSARLPTGIDRVCLAYIAHYGACADAVIQWKGRRFVLTGADAQRVMAILLAGTTLSRRDLVTALARALPRALVAVPRRRQIYLNIGHTGLDDPGLVTWIAEHDLRAVHLIHDLIPIETPEYCRPGEADKHIRRMTNALASASGIIGNSQATVDALERFAISRELRHPPTTTAWLAGDVLPASATATVLDRPYFVSVGTIEGRKNHLLLLQTWQRLVARLGDRAPLLVLVGQRGWEAAAAFALLDRATDLRGAVREYGRCDDTELAGLLRGARALLMPSFAEGFGMPVIEALQLGAPVIASDLAVFREIAGTIPTFLPAHDAVAWEQAILDFCAPAPERARQIEAMRGYRVPDWPGHFATVDQWLETLPA
ncbi:glycosyltransferase family 4 protein [Sphingomonas sp. PAMC 26621]|uniref:glycosyltransferase family 4 protein n=1 Tax=Sphingomonas sp. PAMC 26621 TaxID=1112213 RepID=UPI000288CF22|nr:glycosyltransferase family 1 protein [Sphingomonas sp. PAMC 26621]